MKRLISVMTVLPLAGVTLGLALAGAEPAAAEVAVQCPGDLNGDADWDDVVNGVPEVRPAGVACMHLAAGDGFVNMADSLENPTLNPQGDTRGELQYIFGFQDVTGVAPQDVLNTGQLASTLVAPTISVAEGDELYLSLTNVGMVMRPDLADAHTIHWHGFPNASAVFDGVPDVGLSVHMGGTLTYYYNVVEPGTYIYHCHVEAAEHMEMGMYGNLFVTPAQDGTPYTDPSNGKTYTRFAYNDGDGSTGYDVSFPIQLSSIDPNFHAASLAVQPLPFSTLKARYALINGRGYPETLIETPLSNSFDGFASQPFSTRVTATQGERVLLRLTNVSITRTFTFASPSIPMKVVGRGARLLRGGDANGSVYDATAQGLDLSYETNSVSVAGGQTYDVLLDTSLVPPGTYFLYTTNLNYLSNDAEDRGGMMTEIVVNAL